MVRMISDAPHKNSLRVMELSYDPNSIEDRELLNKIRQLCSEQPRCENCENFKYEKCIGGYHACACEIHGILESYKHPHFDMDGSKCDDYRRKAKGKK